MSDITEVRRYLAATVKQAAAIGRLAAVKKPSASQSAALATNLGSLQHNAAMAASALDDLEIAAITPADAIARWTADGTLQDRINSGALGNPIDPKEGVDYSHYTGSFLWRERGDVLTPEEIAIARTGAEVTAGMFWFAYRDGQQIARVPVNPTTDLTVLNRQYGVGNR